MLSLLNEWIRILAVILVVWPIVTTSWASLQPIPKWVEYQRYLFLSKNQLHMKLLSIASILVVYIGSALIIGMLASGYVPLWSKNVFSTPLKMSIMVMLLIMATPALIGALPLLYIKRFPPNKWMSNRIARLAS